MPEILYQANAGTIFKSFLLKLSDEKNNSRTFRYNNLQLLQQYEYDEYS
jgi:hypothetical protein